MRSLFVKIFLWFWLAMILVSGASAILAVSMRSHPLFASGWFGLLVMRMHDLRGGWPPPPPPCPELHLAEGALRLSGQTASEIFERDGASALAGYLDRLQASSHLRTFLLDKERREVSGRVVRPETLKLAVQAVKEGKPEFSSGQGFPILAYEVRSQSGVPYFFVAEMFEKPPGPGQLNRYDLPVHIAAMLIVAGIVCYWLASYICAPIKKLHLATRRIADGDFMARVGAPAKNRKDEIAELSRDFDVMATRIESLMLGKRRLLRDISHELRSPLARLGIALELARRRANPEVSPALDRIEREANRLNGLIGQLLALVRLNSGVDKAEHRSVDIVEVVREVAADAEFEANSRNCTVRVSMSGAGCIVFGTEYLLRSAVENVLRNAVLYTREGTEIEVEVRCHEGNDGLQAAITVRDCGPGVPAEALEDLFKPFFRVGEARERGKGGAGLGLTIAERAVRLHGGTVTAANRPDGGLAVTIYLPVTG